MDLQNDDLAFYEKIPPIYRLEDIADSGNFHDVPHNWLIALTDVRRSTIAIEAGKYKQVNAAAAATITAILNEVQRIDVPFVFGGDGATIMIPPSYRERVAHVLIATQERAKESFDLDLRVGIVPIEDVFTAGFDIKIAKLRVSENFQQAIFTGGGIEYAETLLKDPLKGYAYKIEAQPGQVYEADFSGFECRWQEVPSRHGETLSLMVKATDGAEYSVYQKVLTEIDGIFGDRDSRHPITVHNLRLNLTPAQFKTEAGVRFGRFNFKQLRQLAWSTFKGRIAMWFNIQGWGQYKQLFLESTDNEKFDDTLRMTFSGTTEQRLKLLDYLQEERERGNLAFGLHISGHTLVTCIVFDYFGRQVHFVDGADGGYAMAAKQLKSQAFEIPIVRLPVDEIGDE